MPPETTAKIGPHGLTEAQEAMLNLCLALFGSTWFTVSMLCLGGGGEAIKCIETLAHLHLCGCIRKPVNDGGQEYYEVMPSIVNPKKSPGG